MVGLRQCRTSSPVKSRADLQQRHDATGSFHAALRCLGERGNAQLKWYRVLATELRCRPNRCTRMIKAVLTVYYREQQPFAA